MKPIITNNIAWVVVIALLLPCCKKDIASKSDNQAANCDLVAIGNPIQMDSVYWNNTGKVTQIGRYYFTLSNKKLYITFDKPWSGTEKEIYQLNEMGYPTEGKGYKNSSAGAYIYFFYNSDYTLKHAEVVYPTPFNYTFKYDYFWENGNVTRIQTTNDFDSILNEEIQFTYDLSRLDSRRSFYEGHQYNYSSVLPSEIPFAGVAPANPLLVVRYHSIGEEDSYVHYKYEYDSKGNIIEHDSEKDAMLYNYKCK